MGKIGDLFVRLGLKNDEYKKGIEDSKRSTSDFGAKVKSMATAAKAAWAAVGVAVVKFVTDSVKYTQKLGDQWNIAMTGMKAGYGAFIRGLSSGEGWTDLFNNMREAVRMAREAAAALDEVFERKISYGYSAAETEKEIANQQLIMRDASKSDKEREDAAKRIIELEKQLGETKKDIWSQEAKAKRDMFKSQTQMNDAEIDFMVKNYNQNREIIKESRDYLAEKAKLEGQLASAQNSGGFMSQSMTTAAQNGKRAQEAMDALKALDAATSQSVKDVAKLAQKYDKSNDELVKNMAEAEVAVINVDTEVARASTRATAMLGTLTKAANVSVSSGPTSDPGLSKAQSINKRAEDSAKSEVQLLNEKYDQEKALLQQYNIDTTALTKEYYKNLFAILDKGIDEELSKLTDIEPVELDLIDTSDIDAELEAFLEQLEEAQRRAEEATYAFAEAISGGFSDACQELMDQLIGLSEFNPGAVVQALLTPLCDLAVKAGEIIMAEGLATIAAKSALETFGITGWGAVAAGAALIAAGTAAKAGLSALASSGSANTSTYTGNQAETTQTQNIESELTVYVKGTLRGSDIVLAAERTQTNWSR